MKMEYPENFWPDPKQEALLKAVIFSGEKGLRAFETWQSLKSSGTLDAESLRLLPMLFFRHEAAIREKTLAYRCRAIHQCSAHQTLLLFAAGSSLIERFSSEGIATLLLKGAVLAQDYYGDPGLRPMADLDLAVREADASRALEILQKEGWVCETPSRRNLPASEVIFFLHGLSFKNKEGMSLDLHWNLLGAYRRPEAEREMWSRARGFNLQGKSSLALCDEDHFFLVCIHGLSSQKSAHLRWVMDAVMILETALKRRSFDWQRVLAVTQKYQLNLKMFKGLSYLKAVFDMPVPVEILRVLEEAEPDALERLDYKVSAYGTASPQNPIQQVKYFRTPVILWRSYKLRCWRMGRCERGSIRRFAGFLRYLLFYMGKKHKWLFPVYLIQEIVKKPKRILP